MRVFAEMEELSLGSDGQLERKETARQAHAKIWMLWDREICACAGFDSVIMRGRVF